MQEQTDDTHSLTMPKIISELAKYDIDTQRKSVYDDLAALDDFGIEIIKEQEGFRTYYYCGKREFEIAGLKILVDAIQSSKYISEKKTKYPIRKQEKNVSTYDSRMLNWEVKVTGRVKDMIIKKLYFDMDGVLADFDRGVRELCNMEPLQQSEHQPVGYDDELWSRVRDAEHFYDKLELIPGAKDLFDYVYGKYGDKCEILTGIPKPKRGIITAGEDKLNWVRRLLSKDIIVNIVLREEKPDYCSGKDCILIDDYALNIREWENCGGTGILFSDAKSVMEKIRNL